MGGVGGVFGLVVGENFCGTLFSKIRCQGLKRPVRGIKEWNPAMEHFHLSKRFVGGGDPMLVLGENFGGKLFSKIRFQGLEGPVRGIKEWNPAGAKRWLNQNKSYRCSRINVNGMLWGQRDIIKVCQSLKSCSGRQNLTKEKWICIAKYIWQLKKRWSFETTMLIFKTALYQRFVILYIYIKFRICWGFMWAPFCRLQGDLKTCCWLNKYWETDSCQNTNMVDGMHLFYCFTGNKKPLLLWLLPPPSCHRRVINIHLSATLANQQHPRTWIFRMAELFVFVYFHIWGYVF